MNATDALCPPDLPLPRDDLVSAPFTPAMAIRSGLGRAGLERAVREGLIVRLLRGVYVAADRPLTGEVRESALALVLGKRQAVVGRTAAWLHGCPTEALVVGLEKQRGIPLELRAVSDLRERTVLVGAVRAESAGDAAIGLASSLRGPAALAAVDGLLRARAIRSVAVLDVTGLSARSREVLARADGRSTGAAESVLRHHWLDARLPTPVLGLRYGGHRLTLALPLQRFGVVVGEQRPPAPPDWTVIAMSPRRILAASGVAVRRHLEREFHQHLLGHAG